MKKYIFRLLVHQKLFFLFIALLLFSQSCKNKNVKDIRSTLTTGTIYVSADESFKPVIDSQIQVFESQHPDAHIVVRYKPEADCLRDLEVDSISMVIVTRGLTEKEQDNFKKSLSYVPSFGILAWDAIAVITNIKSPDSLFTMQDIRSMLKGTSGYKYKVVMDGTKSTSAVRFVVDSLLQGQQPSGSTQGANGSQAVIDYVSNNADAIGLIGVSWIGNKDDTQQVSFLKKVNLAALECAGCTKGPYVKPYQANIYNGRYPMLRPLYYVLKENYDGLGSGFRNFLIYEKGQRIFYRSYLLPARQRPDIKKIDITE